MMSQSPRRLSLLAAVLAAGIACSRAENGAGGAGPGGPGGAMPAMGVEVVTLAPKPVEQRSEFVGTVKSRRSTTIQPQAEGFITRIAVKSGDRVRAGATLFQIDSAGQQASVAALQSQRASRQADLQFARQQLQRQKTLFEAGASSQAEYEQAQTAVETTEAQIQAIESQIRQQQVELGYHTVTAPAAGVVGDIPVRAGDRVTRSTELTTIDANEGLELYLSVPVQQAPQLAVGLPVRLVDDAGQTIAETTIDFVAPSVDPQTQSVLAKAPLQAGKFRTDQYVRAQVVWKTTEGLTIPLTAVNRVSGQFFAFVAEAGEGGATVARQKAVTLGPVVGNEYVLLSGLAPGERLIVSGVQKIGDGAPVQAQAAGQAPAAPGGPPGAAGATEGR
jgi:RND family efflux transporter MFP subunit